jgi:hypothetical protein
MKIKKGNEESTQQFVHLKSRASIHPKSYIQLISSMLDSQCMEHTYHDHHCKKGNRNVYPVIRNHVLGDINKVKTCTYLINSVKEFLIRKQFKSNHVYL